VVRGIALIACLPTAGCLDAPAPGEGAPGGGGDPGGGDDSGGDDSGGDPDAGTPEQPVGCADGAAADVVYASRYVTPVGQGNYGMSGVMLVVNTGAVPLDTSALYVSTEAEGGGQFWMVLAAGETGGEIPTGEARGVWGLDEELLVDKVEEPWVASSPTIEVSLGYNLGDVAAARVDAVVTVAGMTAVLPIEVASLEEASSAGAVETARLPLQCASQ
jgi:hypothetical protein